MGDVLTIEDLISQGDNDAEMSKRRGMSDPQSPGDEYIDRFEGDTAVLIKKTGDGYVTRDVPRSALPSGAKSGDTIPSPAIGGGLYSGAAEGPAIINSLYGAVFPR